MNVETRRVVGAPDLPVALPLRPSGRRAWSRVANPTVLFGLVIVTVVGACALAPSVIAPHDPLNQNLTARLLPPGSLDENGKRYWLGTDWLGRDMLSRIIHGARISMSVALMAVAARGTLGVGMGLISGFYGGATDTVLMRLADMQLALPFLLLAIAVATVAEASMANVVVILAVTGWMAYARLVRSQVLSLREKEFIDAARALGVPNRHIVVRHILPNILGSAIALGTIDVPAMILAESSLSFLGIGVPLTTPSWGSMVALGRNHLVTAWWVPVLPGFAIAMVVLGISLLGDWLRDELDPTLRGR